MLVWCCVSFWEMQKVFTSVKLLVSSKSIIQSLLFVLLLNRHNIYYLRIHILPYVHTYIHQYIIIIFVIIVYPVHIYTITYQCKSTPDLVFIDHLDFCHYHTWGRFSDFQIPYFFILSIFSHTRQFLSKSDDHFWSSSLMSLNRIKK